MRARLLSERIPHFAASKRAVLPSESTLKPISRFGTKVYSEREKHLQQLKVVEHA
jgi:hypothetical protein